MDNRYKIIDITTGDIKGNADTTFPETMTDQGYRFPSHKLGARIFADVDYPLGMSRDDIGAMTIISRRCLVGASNMIGYRKAGNIIPYTSREISEIAGHNIRQGQRFVSRMLRLKVMQRVHTNSGFQFYVNPAYFMRSGQRLSLDLFLLFREELTLLLPAWVMNEFLKQANEKAMIASDVMEEARGVIDG